MRSTFLFLSILLATPGFATTETYEALKDEGFRAEVTERGTAYLKTQVKDGKATVTVREAHARFRYRKTAKPDSDYAVGVFSVKDGKVSFAGTEVGTVEADGTLTQNGEIKVTVVKTTVRRSTWERVVYGAVDGTRYEFMVVPQK